MCPKRDKSIFRHDRVTHQSGSVEQIMSIVSGPNRFSTEDLVSAALGHAEHAPKLVGTIAKRGEVASLQRVLLQFSTHPIFDYCVRAIEESLPDAAGDRVLLQLSEALRSSEKSGITGYGSEMQQEKRTDRTLSEYVHQLNIQAGDLQELANKELLLIGGGSSPVKAELLQAEVSCRVTNIDPLAQPSVDSADVHVQEDFFDVTLQAGQFQEVWALHSLPTYAFSVEQVIDFYQRALLAVAPGGVLRVMPVDGFSDAFTPSMRLNRRPVNNASLQWIASAVARPDLFVVEGFTRKHRHGLGQKVEKHGVTIRVVGKRNEVDEFLHSSH